MLEFEAKWFIILLINFLALIFIMNQILFKPMLKLFRERRTTVSGAIESAKQMSAKKDAALEDMKKSLAEAAGKARATFETLRAEGLDSQKEVVSKAGEDAGKLIDSARASLKEEAENARKSLRADVDKFSDEIVRKLTKV